MRIKQCLFVRARAAGTVFLLQAKYVKINFRHLVSLAVLDVRAGTFTEALVANIMEKQERHRLTLTNLVYCVAA